MSFEKILGERPLMVILRGVPVEESVRIANLAWDTGLATVEVPIQTPDAVQALTAVAAAAAERGELCGAGTVITTEQVAAARTAGAAFTVAPGFDPDVLHASAAAGLPHLPGVATATEVQTAVRHGCSWLKMFPAALLGPAWISQLDGPFPGLSFVATGGLTSENAVGLLAAGAKVVGVGSSVTRAGGLDALVEVLRAHQG